MMCDCNVGHDLICARCGCTGQIPAVDDQVFIDCGCTVAGRPGIGPDGSVCVYCGGEGRHEVPF